MNSSSVCIFTQSHNSQSTISRAIESVLGQSYSDLAYYIVDNASTDRTRDIISHYGKRDSRVRAIYCEQNQRWHLYTLLPELIRKGSNSFFAQLDADDEYYPRFLEEIRKFMDENKVDIASCTSKYLDGVTGRDISRELLTEPLIIESSGFQSEFPAYFKYFRDSWGKVFSFRVFEGINFSSFDSNIMTSSVSYISFEAVLQSSRIGVYPQQLHKYYAYPDSFERNPKGYKRILTPKLFQYYKEFIIRKCGFIDKKNLQFLSNAFCRAICSKMQTLQIELLPSVTVMELIQSLFQCEFMSTALDNADRNEIRAIRTQLLEWTDVLDKKSTEKDNVGTIHQILRRIELAIE